MVCEQNQMYRDGLVDDLDTNTEQTVKDDALEKYNTYMHCIDNNWDSDCEDVELKDWEEAKEKLASIGINNPEETISNMDGAYEIDFW